MIDLRRQYIHTAWQKPWYCQILHFPIGCMHCWLKSQVQLLRDENVTCFIFFLIWSEAQCNFPRRHTCLILIPYATTKKISKIVIYKQIGSTAAASLVVVVGVKVRNNANICQSDFPEFHLKNQLAFGELMAQLCEVKMRWKISKQTSIVFKNLIFH